MLLMFGRVFTYFMAFHSAGAAFDKHLIQLYAYSGENNISQHLEVSGDVLICLRNQPPSVFSD